MEAAPGVLEPLLKGLGGPDSHKPEITIGLAEAPTDGEAAWTFLFLTDLIPGFAEALSAQLQARVVTWFWDPGAGFARLEVCEDGKVAGVYPARLIYSEPTRVADPTDLDGTADGLLNAARVVGVPLAWKGEADGKVRAVRIRV